MSTEDWIVITNLLVAVTSILAAAAAERDAVKAMRETAISVVHALMRRPIAPQELSQQDGEDAAA